MLRQMIRVQTALCASYRRFLAGQDGATAIEYGLIAAGIAVAIIAAVFAIGDELTNFFTAVQTKLANAYS